VDLEVLIAILFLVAYGPSILLTIIIARAKRYRREPGMAIFKAFLWGATGAAAIALVVNTFTMGAFVRPAIVDERMSTIVAAVIVAPIVEEAVKPLVLYMGTVKRNCDELVDGLIYGAVAGLGFAATENLLYEVTALIEHGTEGFIATAIARTFSATLLHAVASAIVGYGIAMHLNRRFGILALPPMFIVAVAIHSAYNAVVSLAPAILLLPLIATVIWGFFFVRRRIRQMSLVPPSNHWIVLGSKTSRPPGEPPDPPTPPQHWIPVEAEPAEESETWVPVAQKDPEKRGKEPRNQQ
jgi:protease PrsW